MNAILAKDFSGANAPQAAKLDPVPVAPVEKKPVSDFLSALKTKSYFHMPSTLIEWLAAQENLSKTCGLGFLYLFGLAFFERHCGNKSRAISISNKTLAKRLGKSKATASLVVNTLQEQGLLNVQKRCSSNGATRKNELNICLPEELIEKLLLAPDKKAQNTLEQKSNQPLKDPLDLIEQTKTSIQIPFHLLLGAIGAEGLSGSAKLLWLFLYEQGHAALKGLGECFVEVEIATLCRQMKLGRSALFVALGLLEEQGYLERSRRAIGISGEKIKLSLLLPKPIALAVAEKKDREPTKSTKTSIQNVFTTLSTEIVDKLSKIQGESGKLNPIVRKTEPYTTKLFQQNINNLLAGGFSDPIPAEIPETEKPAPSPVSANSKSHSQKVFFEKTEDGNEEKEKLASDLTQAKAIFERFEKNAKKLLGAGLGALDAKRLAATNLNEIEKNALFDAALRAQKQKEGCPKLQSLLGSPKTRFVLFGSRGKQEGAQINPSGVLKTVRAQAERATKPAQTPLQKKSGQAPLRFDEIVSLSPKALLDAKHVRQLSFHLNRMQQAGLLKGYAKQVPIGLLRTEVALMAATFSMRSPVGDKTALAISIACKKIREGTWSPPWGLSKVREQLWRAKKRQMYGPLKTDGRNTR